MLDDLTQLIHAAIAEWKIPGLAIAVVHEGEPIFVEAFGFRDVAAQLPVTTDTQFLLCSLTKSFTAAGLSILVDERRLDLDKPVRDILSEFRLHDPVATERITVHDLLCHRTGLPRHDWIWKPADLTRAQMLVAMRHLEPSCDIRQRYQYSNLGYMVAGMVAERITGQSWEAFTQERVLAPLGITGASFSTDALAQAADAARPYWMVDDEPGPAPLYPITTVPAGGLNAAVNDLLPYLRFLLGDGAPLLSKAGLRRMQTPFVYAGGSEFEEVSEQHYGLGLACYHYRGERAVAHDGGWVGWGTRIDMLPGRKLGVAVLTNRAPNPVTTMLTHAVFDRICGKDPVPWFDRFQKRRRDFLAGAASAKSARGDVRPADMRPTRALAQYAGEYDHPGYGRFSIELDPGALAWRYRGVNGPLLHKHHDVFEVPEMTDRVAPDLLTVSFGYDRDGAIDRLSAPFEPMVPDIVFRRAPDGEALDPVFRDACVGTYVIGVQTHRVVLDADGHLTLTPSDQPTYRLVPYQGRTFRIVELDGFRVEFRFGEAKAAEAVVFHQPDGTYLAQRVVA